MFPSPLPFLWRMRTVRFFFPVDRLDRSMCPQMPRNRMTNCSEFSAMIYLLVLVGEARKVNSQRCETPPHVPLTDKQRTEVAMANEWLTMIFLGADNDLFDFGKQLLNE